MMNSIILPDLIDTGRLILRRWTPEDAEELFGMASDPEIGTSAGWRPHQSVHDSIYAIESWRSSNGVYAIVSRSYGRPVGCIEAHADPDILRKGPRDVEMGFWIGRRYWGQGFAAEALSALMETAFSCGASRVWCQCLEGNIQSARVMEKCGMSFHHRSVSANDFTGEVIVCYYVIKKGH